MRVSSLGVSLLLCLCFFAAGWAEGDELAAPKKKSQFSELTETDPLKLAEAISTIKATKNVQGAQLLVERIRQGLSAPLLEKAMEAVLVVGGPSASTLLSELAQHRRAEVRVKVAVALSTVKTPIRTKVLLQLLDDLDPKVRAAAATALGKFKTSDGVEPLMQAASLGTFEAATALGQLARPQHMPRLLGLINEQNFALFAPILQRFMLRQDLSAPLKVSIISRIGTIPLPEVKVLLDEVCAKLPKGDPVKKAAVDALNSKQPPPAPHKVDTVTSRKKES
jgi:HEAT repeat protein